MDYLEPYADSRLIAACIYCGTSTETRDRCSSRVLLDEPYPETLRGRSAALRDATRSLGVARSR